MPTATTQAPCETPMREDGTAESGIASSGRTDINATAECTSFRDTRCFEGSKATLEAQTRRSFTLDSVNDAWTEARALFFAVFESDAKCTGERARSESGQRAEATALDGGRDHGFASDPQ